MPQNVIHIILYSLVSGLAEFLPISSSAHQLLYKEMTGFPVEGEWLTLAVRIGVLLALLAGCHARMKRFSRDLRLSRRSSRHRKGSRSGESALADLRLLRTAGVPVLISVLFYMRAGEWINNTVSVAITLFLNAMLLFAPRLWGQGNKDGRSLSFWDGVLMGLLGGLAAIPGISQIAGVTCAGLIRGGRRAYILDVALLLCIPLLLGLLVFDIYAVAVCGIGLSLSTFFLFVLSIALSFLGGYLGIITVRFLSVNVGFGGFGYYSLGLALFAFALYLVI